MTSLIIIAWIILYMALGLGSLVLAAKKLDYQFYSCLQPIFFIALWPIFIVIAIIQQIGRQ
jgi:hypothetical protein